MGEEGHAHKHTTPQFSALVTGATLKHPQLRVLLRHKARAASPLLEAAEVPQPKAVGFTRWIDCELSSMAVPRGC